MKKLSIHSVLPIAPQYRAPEFESLGAIDPERDVLIEDQGPLACMDCGHPGAQICEDCEEAWLQSK